MTTVTMTMTVEQADSLSMAADLYARICIGQFEEVAMLARMGIVPEFPVRDLPRKMATPERADDVRRLMDAAKIAMGYPTNGSMGIGNAHVHITAHRAYELKKVIDRALAMHRNPKPDFRGVNYDGLIVRYTNDPEPTVRIEP